jgi:hypothetical protein
MSTDQSTIIAELLKRRSSLAPEQGAIVDELAKRMNLTPPPTTPSQPIGRSLEGFGNNIRESGKRMIGDIAGAVSHPLDTAKAVGGIVAGLGEKLIPGEKIGHEQNVDALVKMYKDRYGSLENLAKTLYEDPVGALADISTLAGGAGLAAKGVGLAAKTANLGKAASVAGKVAKVAGTVAEVTDPMNVITKPVAAVAGKSGMATRLYESALKPSLGKKNLPKIAGEIQTGLSEKIPVSAGGAQKIADAIDELQASITKNVTDAKNAGKTVSAEDIAKRADDLKAEFGKQVNPNADLRAIDKAKREFLNKYAIRDAEGKITGYKPIPVDEAQASKIATYQQVKKNYGQLSAASIEAQKSLARGIKEELVVAIPELADLNARESKLLNLDGVMEKAVSRIRNHQLFGIGTPLAMAGAEAATHSPKVALAIGAMRAVLEQPQIKSRIAIALNSLKARNPAKYGRPSRMTVASRVQEYIDSLSASISSVPEPQVP